MAKRDWYCEDVLSGKIEVHRTYEDERVVAFHHPYPVSDVHVVVIPKEHVPSLLDARAIDGDLLASMLKAIQQTAAALQLEASGSGFYVRANASAPGVTPHMHWHIIGPGAGSNWPSADPKAEDEQGN